MDWTLPKAQGGPCGSMSDPRGLSGPQGERGVCQGWSAAD